MTQLPIFAMEKLLKQAGAKRVAESAKQEVQTELEKRLVQVTKKAMLFAKHARRKTIKKEDITLAKD